MKLSRNSPEILRLSRVEDWRKARVEKALREADQPTAYRAAELYTAAAARAQSVALSSVSSYCE
jgi:hypothetical protein